MVRIHQSRRDCIVEEICLTRLDCCHVVYDIPREIPRVEAASFAARQRISLGKYKFPALFTLMGL
jgi:hypothetical protein